METERNATRETYEVLDRAASVLNEEFFGGQLKPCLISVQRLRGVYGCYAKGRYEARDQSDVADALILDARHWGPHRSDADKLATLVHELVHHWQRHFGKAAKTGYHNRQFARKMFEIGLVTSDTGQPGGRPVGPRMSHYIWPGGRFGVLCTRLLDEGLVLPYYEPTDRNDLGLARRHQIKAQSKSAYACPDCDPPVRVWGKPRLKIVCGNCEELLVCEQPDRSWEEPTASEG